MIEDCDHSKNTKNNNSDNRNNNGNEEDESELFRIIRHNNMAEEGNVDDCDYLREACAFELHYYILDKSSVPKMYRCIIMVYTII